VSCLRRSGYFLPTQPNFLTGGKVSEKCSVTGKQKEAEQPVSFILQVAPLSQRYKKALPRIGRAFSAGGDFPRDYLVEAVGIEPTSEDTPEVTATCLVGFQSLARRLLKPTSQPPSPAG